VRSGQRFFALLFLRADVALAVRRFRVAAAFLPAATRLVDFRAVDLLAVLFLRAGLRAVDFLAVLFLRAGLRADDFFAVDFRRAGLRAVVFLAAVFRRAGFLAAVFFAAVFRRAGLRAELFFALDRFRAAVFFAAISRPPFLPGSYVRAVRARSSSPQTWITTPSV
jgi:hypothetical protein